MRSITPIIVYVWFGQGVGTSPNYKTMAQTVKDFREFVGIAGRKDITKATVKRNLDGSTKFKLRGPHGLYTLTEYDASRAQKIIQTFPPDLEVVTIGAKAPKEEY